MILRPSARAVLSLLATSALVVSACSSTPKPLPGGPPPEYEMPRSYKGLDAPAEQPAPAAPPASSDPGAPRPEPDPAKPGDPEAAPPN
ncbi:MAG: hypothetical protein HUU21_23630 [Polyangiaceae bacterium]|nr:hypothetical protein [Polyangiaceae bacterium]